MIMREYDENAEWYASDRTHPTGVPEVTVLAASVPRGARVLDIGCGNGLPITRTLLDAGHHVIGLDSSREMLARFRANLPATPVIRGLVQTSAFADEVFDAAVAWGVATPFASEYGVYWPYAIAAVTTVGRAASREHWLSDSVGGSVLGYALGRVFWRSGQERHKDAPRLMLSPQGVALQWDLK